MPNEIQVVVTLPSVTGIPADNVVNTFAFGTPDLAPGTISPIIAALDDFYGTIGGWIGRAISRSTGVYFEVFDLEAPLPRVPVFAGSGSLLPSPDSLSQLPSEMAVCLSFKAPYASGESNARKRGRVYIGPLIEDAADNTTTVARVATDLMNDLLNAANVLASDVAAASSAWCVYSRMDSALYDLTEAWVDNAFDVQRRRGQDPTTRLSVVF